MIACVACLSSVSLPGSKCLEPTDTTRKWQGPSFRKTNPAKQKCSQNTNVEKNWVDCNQKPLVHFNPGHVTILRSKPTPPPKMEKSPQQIKYSFSSFHQLLLLVESILYYWVRRKHLHHLGRRSIVAPTNHEMGLQG